LFFAIHPVAPLQVDPPVKKLLILLVLVVLALAGGVYALGPGRPYLDRLSPPSPPANLETPFPLLHGQLLETVTGTGVVAPQESLIISTDQSGRIVFLQHDVNDVVKEGEELLRLDDRVQQLKLKQAKAAVATGQAAVNSAKASRDEATARYNAARSFLKHAQDLQARGGAEQKSVDDRKAETDVAEKGMGASDAMVKAAEARLREAQEAVDLAELAVRLTRVTVPVVVRPTQPRATGDTKDLGEVLEQADSDRPKRSYTILERKVSLNQLIGPPVSGQLFVLTPNARELQVNAQIAESDIHRVKEKMRVWFTVSAYDDHYFTGRVTEVKPLPTVTAGSTYYTAVVTVDEAPGDRDRWPLQAGMTMATLDVVTRYVPAEVLKDKEGVWMVPDAAIGFPLDKEYWAADVKEAPTPRSDQKVVWISEDGHTGRPLLIKTGASGKVLDKDGTGLRSETYTEVKDWGPGAPALAPGEKPAFEVITGAPPVKKGKLQLPSLFKS
jgi:multidrug efflux pump subunit AcrA (membrane-fusion protein)